MKRCLPLFVLGLVPLVAAPARAAEYGEPYFLRARAGSLGSVRW